jgi:hypothetical protein
MTTPVMSLLNRIQKTEGLTLSSVNDGVRWEKIPAGSNLSQRKFAADVINSVDESWVEIKNGEGKTACLFIVPDLSGDEIVADWIHHSNFGDSLDKVIEAHQDYWEAKLHG